MGVSRGRAPAVGFFTTTEDSQTAQGQQARERSLFLLLLPVPTLPVSRVARVGSAQIHAMCWVGGIIMPANESARPARGPGAESQVRPILIFARHCLLPDVSHSQRRALDRAGRPGRNARAPDPAALGTLPAAIAPAPPKMAHTPLPLAS